MRNVDKIKTLAADLKQAETSAAAAEEAVRRLEHELGRMKKAVDDRNKQIEALKKVAGAADEVQRMLSAYMIEMALRYKLTAQLEDGTVLDNCLELPATRVEEIMKEWTLLPKGKAEDGSVLMQAVKREVQNTKAEV
jgi:chromosome segregation ATPase